MASRELPNVLHFQQRELRPVGVDRCPLVKELERIVDVVDDQYMLPECIGVQKVACRPHATSLSTSEFCVRILVGLTVVGLPPLGIPYP